MVIISNMTKFKVLGPLFLIILFVYQAKAAQVALVIAQQAVVYADQQLTTPIGYVKNGKKIKVGDVKRKKGTILPIIISGRVAFIKTRDIALQDIVGIEHTGHRISEHDIEQNFKKDADRLNEHNFLQLSLNNQGLGSQWKDLNEAAGNETADRANSISLSFEHRPLYKRMSWGIGASYYSVSSENVSLQTVTIDSKFYYDLLRFKYFSIQGYGGLLLTGDVQVKTTFSDGFESLSKGTGYGYTFGGQARILPHGQWGLTVGAAITTLNTNLDPIEVPGTEQETELSSFGGVGFYLGLSYSL